MAAWREQRADGHRKHGVVRKSFCQPIRRPADRAKPDQSKTPAKAGRPRPVAQIQCVPAPQAALQLQWSESVVLAPGRRGSHRDGREQRGPEVRWSQRQDYHTPVAGNDGHDAGIDILKRRPAAAIPADWTQRPRATGAPRGGAKAQQPCSPRDG